MEIKKYQSEVIKEIKKTVENPVIEETPEPIVEVNIEKITKFDEYTPVNENINYYEDMNIEEKVEHLNERLRNIESRI